MMKIVFKGKSSEYEIQRSCFCVDAFVIKDKIEERDGVDFITSNVDLLEFSDDSFTFEEIVKHFNICDTEDMIIVEDFDMKSNKDNQNSFCMLSIKSCILKTPSCDTATFKAVFFTTIKICAPLNS